MIYRKYEIKIITSFDSLTKEIALIKQTIHKYSTDINNMFPPTYFEREMYGAPLTLKEKMQLFKYKIIFQREHVKYVQLGMH